MNNLERKIINSIVDININRITKQLNSPSTTLIYVEDRLKISNDKVNWKTFETLKSENFANWRHVILDNNTLSISNEAIMDYVVFESEISQSEEQRIKTIQLKKLVEAYFKERGTNLHIVAHSGNATKLIEGYNYNVAIALIGEETRVTIINEVNEVNLDISKKLYWILPTAKEEAINREKVFYLECGAKLELLAHPAAYLNQLSLNKEVKDYNYSVAKFLSRGDIDTLSVNIDSSLQNKKWEKNFIVNLNDRALFLGGELANGENLVSSFMIQLLDSRLKSRLMDILITKPSRGSVTSLLQSVIGVELENFYNIRGISNGIYKGYPVSFTYNGIDYKVIDTNERLEKGYRLHIVDVLEATEEDRLAHKMTPINIILLLEKQVRFIKLNVEVI